MSSSASSAAVSAQRAPLPAGDRARLVLIITICLELALLLAIVLPQVYGAWRHETFFDHTSGVWVAGNTPSAATVGSAVHMVVRAGYATRPLSRWSDSHPFYGGGEIEHDYGWWPNNGTNQCTTGFAVWRHSDHAPGITSAAHCGTNADWHTSKGTPVGTSSSGNSGVDAM